MKLYLSSIFLFITLMTVSANTIVLDLNQESYFGGGEVSAFTSQNGNFETFSVQNQLSFVSGQVYNYNLSSVDSDGHYLSEGAALLYSQFINGTLGGYDYNNPLSRKVDDGLLQSAIWYLQDQLFFTAPFTIPTVDNNPYYDYVWNTLNVAAFTPNNGKYDVDILQIYNGNSPIQNQLVIVPAVPDNDNTLCLAGLGMLSLIYFRHVNRPVGEWSTTPIK